VFSATQGQWLSPISIPPPLSAAGPQRLWALGLSPDGSKLAISDPGAYALYVVNLNGNNSVTSYPIALNYSPITTEPCGLAITNGGVIYFATFDLDGDGGMGYLFSLDTTSGKTHEVTGTNGGNDFLPTQGPDPNSRLIISADGSRVYFNDSGEVGYVDTSIGEFISIYNNAQDLGEIGYEIELAANQTRLLADGLMTDSNLNPIGWMTLDNAQEFDAEYLYGATLSADGNLLFQPNTQSIDVFDGQTGSFRARVGLPMPLSPNYRALVANSQDSTLVAITGTGDGIAVIDLDSIPEPTPAAYFQKAVRANAAASNRARVKRAAASHRTTRPIIRRKKSPMIQTLRALALAQRVRTPQSRPRTTP
jgi:hypothetical protein